MVNILVIEKNDQEGMRTRILDQATRLFVSNGFAAISMREIAEAVGVSKAGLYYHFANKEDLMVAVLREYLSEVGGIVKEARESAPDIFARLLFLTTKIFEQPVEKRAIIRLASQEMGNLSSTARTSFNTLYHNEFIGQIESILKDGMVRGEIRSTQSEILCWILLGMMYPFFYPSASRNSDQNQEVVNTILQIFFDGLRRTESQ